MNDKIASIKDFLVKHKIVVIIVAILVVIVLIVNKNRKEEKLAEQSKADADKRIEELYQQAQNGNSDDNIIMQMQTDLEKNFGKAPSGFVWDVDGTLLSLGDKDMSAEDVVYAYFKGLSSLDMGTVSLYSRGSSVKNTYAGYFSETNKNTDYTDQFTRTIYKDCLLSMQVEKIDNVSVFAENKQVFTVSVKMLDLTDKDFWKSDQMDIYRNLYVYSNDESDTTKGDIYLYDYITKYYESNLVKYRTTKFDVTVQKYPDLDSGWLVSIDTDVDTACKYKDGTIVVSYIKQMYRDYGLNIIRSEKQNKPGRCCGWACCCLVIKF